MEAASSSYARSMEDARADDADHDAALPPPPPPLPSLSSSTSSPSRSPVPSHRSLHASSSSSSSHLGRQMECWICFDTRTSRSNPIVTHRCRCRGSVGFVHQKCIDRWVIQQQNRTCRSCGAVYRMVHSEYPAGSSLPLDKKGRSAFLLKFLVKPLFWEVAETSFCVLLRFLIVPLVLGLCYNIHLIDTIVWAYPSFTNFLSNIVPQMRFTDSVTDPTVLWLLNIDDTAIAKENMNWSTSLAAWLDTMLYGLVVCTVMNAIHVASRNWNKYFKVARRQHEAEVAQQADAAEAARAEVGNGNGGGGGAAAEQREGAGEHALRPQPFFAEPPLEGWRPEWGPVPVDTDFEPDAQGTRAAAAAAAAEGESGDDTEGDWEDVEDGGEGDVNAAAPAPREQRRAHGHENHVDDFSSESSSGSGSDSESDDDDFIEEEEEEDGALAGGDEADAEQRPARRLSFVDEVFDWVAWVKKNAGGGGLRKLRLNLTRQVMYGLLLTLFLRCPLGRMVLGIACVAAVAGWRFRYSRNVLATPRRRFDEVARRVPLLSPEAVRTLFYLYLVDAFFFYGVFPELGGIMLHYALAPYLDIGLDSGVAGFFYGLTVWRIVVYWAVGALLVMLLTAMELTVVSALFANGVELFFVRSFDARWDSVLGYWRCVITQVFDADPPRIIYGFARVAVVELLVLLLFVRMPFWAMFGLRDAVWGDGSRLVDQPHVSSAHTATPVVDAKAGAAAPLKLSFDLKLPSDYVGDQDFTFAEWRRAEALQLLDQKVLLPFGEFYAEMIGSRPSFSLDGHNRTAAMRMDPLVAAAVLVTSSTPGEMWAEAWGNLSDNAVFTLDLLDPAAATKVAELSEGFSDTLARVRAPLAWVRQATRRGGICDTLTALSSPADLSHPGQHDGSGSSSSKQGSSRLPAVDLESLLRPPNVVLPHPNATAARNRQMIYEAWQRAHYNAVQHIRYVTRVDYGGGGGGGKGAGLGGLYEGEEEQYTPRTHTVNVVSCYVTLLQVMQPFMRMGRWHTAFIELWSMLLIQNPYLTYGVLIIVYLYAFCVAVACFGVFPLQRAQLRLLLPYVQWVGRRVVHMEDYLFDPEQVRAVEDFVHADVDDELGLPPMVEPLGFNRREDYIDASRVPRCVVLRRVVVSVLFFAAASLMVWTVPVLCGSLLLSFTTNAVPLLIGATLLSFFVWSPSLLGRAALFGGAMFLALVFAVPLLLAVYVAPPIQAFHKAMPTLVEETFERHYNIHQLVGPYVEGAGEGEESDWETDSTSSGDDVGSGTEAAASERDELESEDSSDAEAAPMQQPMGPENQ